MWSRISRFLFAGRSRSNGARTARRARSLWRTQSREEQRALTFENLETRQLLAAVRATGFTLTPLAAGDNGSSPAAVTTGITFNYFGTNYSNLYVNNDGNVTLDAAAAGYTGESIATTHHPVIAPFWADVDTSNGAGTVSYGPGTVTVSINGTDTPRPAFAVNWTNVGSYSQKATPTDSFQMVLIDRSDRAVGDVDLEFNYDAITWDTGDAKAGIPAPPPAARAGFTAGTTAALTYYSLIGSGITGALLDTNAVTGLVHSSLRSSELGRYVFQFTTGTPLNSVGLAGQAVAISADVTYYGAGVHPYLQPQVFQTSGASSIKSANADTLITGGSSGLNLTGTGIKVGVIEASEPTATEDVNGNGVLDPTEDTNGNGVLDPTEDTNGNGVLDTGEDTNGNGVLDPAEDTNGNGVLDPAEDTNGNGTIDVTGGTNVRITHQDLTGRATISGTDTGIYSNHATAVAGTIAGTGTNADALGFAPSASIVSFPVTTDFGISDADAAGLNITNHGYNYDFGWYQLATTENFNGGPFVTSGPNNEDLNGNGINDKLSLWLADRSAGTEDARFGAYSDETQAIDQFLSDASQPNRLNLVSVQSAGNDRDDKFTDTVASGYAGVNRYVAYFSAGVGGGPAGWYSVVSTGATVAPGSDGNSGTGYDSLPSAGTTSKNAIVVGAVNGSSSSAVAAFSDWGPTDDGRIKPDLVADGTSVFSTTATSNSAYGSLDGTSMAAASVSGTVALLTEYYNRLGIGGGNPTSATMKALLIHTATDLYQTGPDYRSGWGLVNALGAANMLTRLSVPPAAGVDGIKLEAPGAGGTYIVNLDEKHAFTATLVWTDPAGTGVNLADPALATDPAASDLFNDLDMTITGPDGTVYRPWVLNPSSPSAAATTGDNSVDNVEQIRMVTKVTGAYTIHVTGAAAQAFSLLYSGSAQTLDALEPNDTIATASFLGSNDNVAIQALTIHDAQDRDVFRITAHQTGKLVVNAVYDPTNGDLNVRAVDKNGNTLADSSDATPGHLVFPVVGQQTYYIEVSSLAGATNAYSLEVESFAAPQVDLVDLPPTDLDNSTILNDTGTSQRDDITNRVDADILIEADLSDYATDSITILDAAGAAQGGPGVAVEVFVNGKSIGFADPVAGSDNTLFRYTFAQGQLPVQQFPSEYGGWLHYVKGAVTVLDGQKDASGNAASAKGRSLLSSPLQLVIDNVAPTVSIDGVVADDATATGGLPTSLAGLVTSKNLPKFSGQTEAGAMVRLWTDGATITPAVIDASDTLQGISNVVSATGQWTIATRVGLNDPIVSTTRDGLRQIAVTAEDLAGNVSQPVFRDIFLDTQGPQVTDVRVTDDPTTDADESAISLLTGKGLVGPTPQIKSITISVSDLPIRDANFLYGALSTLARDGATVGAGYVRIVGNTVGTIAVQQVIIGLPAAVAAVTDATTFTGQAANFNGSPVLSTTDDTYNGWVLDFTSGALVGQRGVVVDYIGDTRTFVFNAGTFSAAPSANDTYQLSNPGDATTTPAVGTMELQFAQALPDDRYRIIVSSQIVDPAGNALTSASTTSGATEITIAQFTLDHQAEIGVWSRGRVYLDTNGNRVFDTTAADPTQRDVVLALGSPTDFAFNGNFPNGNTADGYDKVAVYGKTSSGFRFLIDYTNDGLPDLNVTAPGAATGMPVAGDFAPSSPGDELGIFTGKDWLFYQSPISALTDPVRISSGISGYPFVGDFDGDAAEDLGTWNPGSNTVSLSISSAGGGVANSITAGKVTATHTFAIEAGYPFSGTLDRPVAADMDGDGIDDLGLWVPDRSGMTPSDTGEWYFLVSNSKPLTDRILATANTEIGSAIQFLAAPFGNDIYAKFGDRLAMPLAGNFDPPLVAGSSSTSGTSSTGTTTSTPTTTTPTTSTQTTGTGTSSTTTTTPTTPSTIPTSTTSTSTTIAAIRVTAISDIDVSEDAAARVLDLSKSFTHSQGKSLTYSIKANTNSALVEPTLTGSQLQLAFKANQSGKSQITIQAKDALGMIATDTFELRVAAANDAPQKAAEIPDVAAVEDSNLTAIDLSGIFRDVDGDTLTYSVSGNTNTSLVTARTQGSQLLLSLNQDRNGSSQIRVRATDGSGLFAEETFQVQVTPVNDPPVASSVATQVNARQNGLPQVIDLGNVFADPDGSPLRYSMVSQSGSLVLTDVRGSCLMLTIRKQLFGDDSIIVRATDSSGATADHTFQIHVAQTTSAAASKAAATITPSTVTPAAVTPAAVAPAATKTTTPATTSTTNTVATSAVTTSAATTSTTSGSTASTGMVTSAAAAKVAAMKSVAASTSVSTALVGPAAIGVRTSAAITMDTHGNGSVSSQSSSGDLVLPAFGLTTDYVISGRVVENARAATGTADRLIAYGRSGNNYRWLVDFNGDGVADKTFTEKSGFVGTGVPIAGDFDGNASNGDEIGLFTGSQWYLDRDHDFLISDETPLTSAMTGKPVAGDFDGDGLEDLATWNSSLNRLQLSLSSSAGGGALNAAKQGRVEATNTIQLPTGVAPVGLLDRLFAGDFDGDGIDDLGIWTSPSTAKSTSAVDRWSLAVSGGKSTLATLNEIAARRASFVLYTLPSSGEPIVGHLGG